MARTDVELIAHLFRRAGFGATRGELEKYAVKGYEATVEELLTHREARWMGDDLVRRYHFEASGMDGSMDPSLPWLYRMATTDAPLREKVALLWHSIFATANSKVASPKSMDGQIKMFREHGMGSFKTLLVELSRDPAMIVWLDNQDNHNGAINENYGRELLELFSMGVGNYSEEDIKECARAFTGWTIGNTEYMIMRSQRDSIWPYGRIGWHFEYRPEDHDDGEKVFLGERGRFNGEDVVDIICQQPATARFISRHLYHFFVADEPPVTQWPYTPPRDPEAIETLCAAYYDNDYDIRSVLRVLFNSDFFRSSDSWYEKIKSPAELVAGVIRVTGDSQRPRLKVADQNVWIGDMGQQLLNPPSVDGWHQGVEWVDTGNFVERLNFASGQFGDVDNPGVRAMISRIASNGEEAISPEQLVDACLDEIGAISVSNETRAVLVEFASQDGDLSVGPAGPDEQAHGRIGDLLAMVASTREYQRT